MNFHGLGSTKEQQDLYSGLPEQAARRGYAVVTPDGSGEPKDWNSLRDPRRSDDFWFVSSMLRDLDTRVCIDHQRLYATGMSSGSAFAGFLACTDPYQFAAVAMVALVVPPVGCPSDVHIAVIAFAGTSDPVVPFNGGQIHEDAAYGQPIPAAPESIRQWSDLNRCATATRAPVPPDGDVDTHNSCADNATAVMYTINGGGHTWPGSPVDLAAVGATGFGVTSKVPSTALILDFFDAHHR